MLFIYVLCIQIYCFYFHLLLAQVDPYMQVVNGNFKAGEVHKGIKREKSHLAGLEEFSYFSIALPKTSFVCAIIMSKIS